MTPLVIVNQNWRPQLSPIWFLGYLYLRLSSESVLSCWDQCFMTWKFLSLKLVYYTNNISTAFAPVPVIRNHITSRSGAAHFCSDISPRGWCLLHTPFSTRLIFFWLWTVLWHHFLCNPHTSYDCLRHVLYRWPVQLQMIRESPL